VSAKQLSVTQVRLDLVRPTVAPGGAALRDDGPGIHDARLHLLELAFK
jgi:hypothetical protein